MRLVGDAAPGASEPKHRSALTGVLEPEIGLLAELELALAEAPRPAVEATRLDLEAPVVDAGPDVQIACCDLSDRAAVEAIEALTESLAGPLVLVVDDDAGANAMKAALRAGAAGLVRRRNVESSLASTVGAVRAGQLAAPPELIQPTARPILSRRQKQVMGLVVLGLSNGEIAAKMHLSEHTVKCHLYASFRKLEVNSREQAVALILDPEEGLGPGILAISPGP
jgi:DNA-binding NarL/FixJ family response regulator